MSRVFDTESAAAFQKAAQETLTPLEARDRELAEKLAT